MTLPFSLDLSEPGGWLLRGNVPRANIPKGRKQKLPGPLRVSIVPLTPGLNYDIHEPQALLLSWAPSSIR